MKIEIFEYIFNKMNGKNIESFDLKNPNNIAEVDSVFTAIKTSIKESCAEGAEKTCTFFGDKKIYALLKNKTVTLNKAVTQFKENAIIEFNHWLIEQGVETPKLYSMFYADSRFCQIYDKARGEQVYLSVYNKLVQKALNVTEIVPALFSMTKEQKTQIGNYLFNHNLTNQEIMLNLPQSEFDKLLNSYKKLYDIGFTRIDSNTGNVTVSEQGFSILDINLLQTLESLQEIQCVVEGKKCSLNKVVDRLKKSGLIIDYGNLSNNADYQSELAETFLYPFLSSCDFGMFLDEHQIRVLKNNDIKILKKAVDTISNANIKFPLTNGTCYIMLSSAVADYNDYAQIVESQFKLQKNDKQK